MYKMTAIILLTLFLVGCKTTGIHVIDNPDGTSVKIYYWDGNSQDNQEDIIKIGKHGKLMTVMHNITIYTKYDTPIEFNLENGKSIFLECNKSGQKKDYKGELSVDWQGNPIIECLEHIVTKSDIPIIQINATISFGI